MHRQLVPSKTIYNLHTRHTFSHLLNRYVNTSSILQRQTLLLRTPCKGAALHCLNYQQIRLHSCLAHFVVAALPVCSAGQSIQHPLGSPSARFRTTSQLIACMQAFSASSNPTLSDSCELQVHLSMAEHKVLQQSWPTVFDPARLQLPFVLVARTRGNSIFTGYHGRTP